jgi:hypothetical protein
VKNVSFLINATASVALHRTSEQLQVTVREIEDAIPFAAFLDPGFKLRWIAQAL